MQVKARENVVTPSPGAAIVELINSDASPPVVIDSSIPASDSLVLNAVSPAMNQVPGVVAGTSTYTGHGPSITPRARRLPPPHCQWLIQTQIRS